MDQYRMNNSNVVGVAAGLLFSGRMQRKRRERMDRFPTNVKIYNDKKKLTMIENCSKWKGLRKKTIVEEMSSYFTAPKEYGNVIPYLMGRICNTRANCDYRRGHVVGEGEAHVDDSSYTKSDDNNVITTLQASLLAAIAQESQHDMVNERKDYVTVSILFLLNLLNFVDRYAIAGNSILSAY
ncbi:hypothetical protein DICVIV_03465 [Dictyocaulus viviparus]|uniref:Uncharacterized protein n=1 Tax=Dictyocaulus viviparus TaxID=29172 RepID=A0A0D8Y117_DICVI|nr:hypothetical protein DICVIV_03465 [Dictyocaulus viviparus]